MEASQQSAQAPSPDLLNAFVSYAQSTFIPALSAFYKGGAAHVGTVCPMPDDMMPNHVGAFYITARPQSPMLEKLLGGASTPITAMYVTMQTAITVAAVLEGRTRYLSPQERAAVLKGFKTQLKFVVHEATHAVGDKNLDTFENEAELTARSRMSAWKESVTELSTQTFLNDIIKQAGIDSCDPEILNVEPSDTGSYVGTVDATAEFVRGLSNMIPGTTYETELRTLVEKGCGRTALEQLIGRALEANGVQDPRLVTQLSSTVGSSMEQLESTYKQTLVRLDRSHMAEARDAMAQLRSRGHLLGKQLVQAVDDAIMNPHSASSRSAEPHHTFSIQDLRDLFEGRYGSLPERPLRPGQAAQGYTGILVHQGIAE